MFKQRKNKRFNYNLRFQENRKDNVNQDSLESKWNNLKQTQKRRKHFLRGLPFLVFALAALIVLILILNSYE
ncbi:MAG: hypothetical protein HKN99_10200 [Winogradskyella sp.]|nr:hypothetical protein [Winogradskyella sp.]NNC46242.1 hypothetical protein [Winogradskyella sp.]NNK39646.1 hypothetical protein [Winogradskyella sp.]